MEPSNSDGTRWTLPGGADYYLTTTKVPDGYTGEVFDHEPVIPYTNYGETIYFEPDYDIEFYQMKNSNYNIYSGSETGNFTARKIGEAESDSLMDAFTEFWFKTFLKGTTIQNEIIKIPAAEAVISNENKTEESSEEVVEVEQYAIWVQKTKGASYTFDLTATVNGTDVTTPVKIVVSENETYNYPGFIDEATLKVTKKNNSVSMSWTAPNDYVDYYLVHRYNPNGTTKEYKLNKTSFNHTGLTAGKTYNYSIYCVYTLNGEEGYVCTPLDREVKLITLKAVTGAKASNNKLHSIKLSWKKVTNAAGYQVKRLNNAGKVLKTMTTTNLYLTDKSLAAATKYTYKIRPYYVENGVKKYGPTVTLKTATICKVPAAPTLKAGTKSMKVSFKKVTGASGYQIVYSTSKKFTSATTKKTTVTGTNATISKTIKSLTKGKTYYVKVRAYVKTATGAKVYTGYSTVKSVKVK